jgi:hypothetical protein
VSTACAAIERVVASEADEEVSSTIAGQGVGEAVANRGEVAGAKQGQVLDVVAQAVREHGPHQVGSLSSLFDEHVAQAVDNINVVAQPADQDVESAAAVEDVILRITDQRVVVA